MRSRLRAVALAALAVAGCGRDEPAGAPSTTAIDPTVAAVPLPASAVTSTTAPAPPEPAQDAALEDGRHAAYVKAVDVGARTVVVDVVQFLTGEQAVLASVADGKGSEVPNDHYIRNVNPRLRTLSLAGHVEVRVLDAVDPARSVPADVTALATLAAAGTPNPFWFTLSGGQVVKVEQQYLP